MLAALKRASAARSSSTSNPTSSSNDVAEASTVASFDPLTQKAAGMSVPEQQQQQHHQQVEEAPPLSRKEPFDINGLRQTGLYSEEYIQELLAGIPPELVCDSGKPHSQNSSSNGLLDDATGFTALGGQHGDPPRLFARLPKRRRINALATDSGSISSSNETANTQATLYDHHPAAVQTPFSRSVKGAPIRDDILAYNEDGQSRLVEDVTLVDGPSSDQDVDLDEAEEEEDEEENDDAADEGESEEELLDEYAARQASTASVARAMAKPVKKHLDPGERKNMQQEDDEDEEADVDGDADTEADILGERVQLLTLATIENLVKAVAEGKSFFGGAGLVAAVAGMGLYEHPAKQASSDNSAGLQDGSGGAMIPPPPLANTEMEEFAKLARWGTTYPTSLDNLIRPTNTARRSRHSPELALKKAYDQAFQVEDRGRLIPHENGQIPSATTDHDMSRQSSAESALSSASPSVHRPDAFDANDRERWAYQEAKLASGSLHHTSSTAIIGSANTKKRKVPTASIPFGSVREAPAISRRTSSASRHAQSSIDNLESFTRDELEETMSLLPPGMAKHASGQVGNKGEFSSWKDPLRDLLGTLADVPGPGGTDGSRAALPQLDPLIKGAQTLAQALHTLTLSAMPPSVYRRARKGHHPTSFTFDKYTKIHARKSSRLPAYILARTADIDTTLLPTPVSLLPAPVQQVPTPPPTPGPAIPMTAKRAAKLARKAAKAKLATTTGTTKALVSSALVTPRLPYLPDPHSLDRFESPSAHTMSEPDCVARSSHLSPIRLYGLPNFAFSMFSRRFHSDLEALHIQRQHLLTLLRVKRKESLLRRKKELEEEKERLSRVLAGGLEASAALGASAASRQAAPRPPKAPPQNSASQPLPQPVPSSSTDPLPPPPDQVAPPELSPSIHSKPPPKKGKKKRSAYANANNVHHRQNYIPSRLPASNVPSKHHKDPVEASVPVPTGSGLGSDILPHNNESEVFNFASDEWMCMFCEYELWYGSKPQVAQCVKKRKKVLKVRQKALDRAKGAVEGTSQKKGAPAGSAGKASDGKSTSKATLPGTLEQAEKAERAQPTPAPPSTPEQTGRSTNKTNAKSQSMPANQVTDALEAQGSATPSYTGMNGISQATLLSYHCLAKGLPQPVYHVTEMRDVIWHDSDDATRDALGEEEPWQAISIELNGDIFKRAVLGNERRKFAALGKAETAPPLDIQSAKEDIAERVLRYLLTEEKSQKALDGCIAKDAGIVIYRPGETEFVVNLKSALGIYNSAWSLLQEYCRLDGREQPSFTIEHINDRYIYSITFEEEKLMTDVGGEDEAREDMSLRMLDTLQQQKSAKLSALIAKSKEERDSLKAETAQVLATRNAGVSYLDKERADAMTLNDID